MLAIIGGTGLSSKDTFKLVNSKPVSTIYGKPSSNLLLGELVSADKTKSVTFLSRHGFKHNIPPHKVNYRANIQALKDANVTDIIAVNAVGGISSKMEPGCIVLPDQIIDYSYGREHSFYSEGLEHVTHIDFSFPYTKTLVNKIVKAANEIDIKIIEQATYACTQGPRLETKAEIQKLLKEGCDIVGMTGMPEAALAREAGINYASISFVANWGAGLSENEITMLEIEETIAKGMDSIKALLIQTAFTLS